MSFKKAPVKGMKDILPAEMALRDYVIARIKETYAGFGFTPIETPCMEDIGNLSNKQGGENEKLIFKILKRGEKLDLAAAKTEDDLVDTGLRYDLTVPLSRYYANNAAQLPAPFRALQIGSVWRADRPQKGRFRQFTQCDIDILGDAGCTAEIELISATTTLLASLGFEGFTVHVNDRRILRAMALWCGFPETELDRVFISLDKLDKVGLDGVADALREDGFAENSIASYRTLFEELAEREDGVSYLAEKLGETMPDGVADNLALILRCVRAVSAGGFTLAFDPSLVRGMSYYTGTIFEITIPGFPGSIAGGGRYDQMIGQFIGTPVPACGFSIGFERIITILMEKGFAVPGGKKKTAFLLDKGVTAETLCRTLSEAKAIREAGGAALVTPRNKNVKFQKEQLTAEGYTDFRDVREGAQA